jgi:adenylate cyclase
LFADVKGSLDLADQVDPEAWHKILNRFFEILADGIHRFEGTVNQYTGDGIMALFGAPITHEDHAHRACYAVLHLRDELRRYAEELKRTQGLTFAVRMGINSGEVVVGKIGDDLRMDYTAQGHTVGLAARLEQLADPGKVYVSGHTAALVGGFFRLRDLGPFNLKGVREQVHVHELEDVGEMRTRLDMSRARGLSPFVGRGEEMETLERSLARSLEGNAQVIGIVAEAGLGKSRLCYEFLEKCRAQGLNVNQAHGVPHGQAIPFFPVLQMIRDYFGITEQESDKAVREKIAGKLLLLDEKFKEALPLLFDFLGVPDPSREAPRMDPEGRQRQLFGVVRRLIHAESERDPGVILAEDLHWIDGGSEAFLEALIDALPGTRALVLVNFRPEYHAAWMKKSFYQQLPLQPLGQGEIKELLQQMLGTDASLAGLAQRLTDRTGGNPYFIEEVVQSLVEAGTLEGSRGGFRLVRPIEEVAIPSTVQAVLAARIDRLAEREKHLLQTAAVIGREFSEPVLKQIADFADVDLADSLRLLVGAEFIYEASIYPELEYAFKHPLTQEVVYRSQLSDRRAQTHGAVAQAIAGIDPEKLDERAALLAHHWERAGEDLEAARWHCRAAEWVGVRDPGEALRHWGRVRSLLGNIPESEETTGLGLMARIQMLNLGWRQGVSDSESDTLFAEGKALAERSGNPYLHALLLFAHLSVKGVGGEPEEALAGMPEVIKLAEQTGDEGLQLMVEAGMTFLLLSAGRLQEGLDLADKAIGRAPEDPRLGAELAGFSPYIQSFNFRATILNYMGRYEESLQDLDRGLALAQEHGDVEVLGWMNGGYPFVALTSGNDVGALSHARQAIEIAEKSGSSMSRVASHWALGTAHLSQGERKEAKEAYEQVLVIARKNRAGLFTEVSALTNLALAHLELGEDELALKTVDEALGIQRRSSRKADAPYTNLVKARVLLHSRGEKARSEIEGALAEATSTMQQSGARCWEPFIHEERAALARLLGDEPGRRQALRTAHRLFKEMKADGHVERLAQDLAPR